LRLRGYGPIAPDCCRATFALNAALCFFRVRFSCSRHRRFVGQGPTFSHLSYFRGPAQTCGNSTSLLTLVGTPAEN
jgi:hypothetical protein